MYGRGVDARFKVGQDMVGSGRTVFGVDVDCGFGGGTDRGGVGDGRNRREILSWW